MTGDNDSPAVIWLGPGADQPLRALLEGAAKGGGADRFRPGGAVIASLLPHEQVRQAWLESRSCSLVDRLLAGGQRVLVLGTAVLGLVHPDGANDLGPAQWAGLISSVPGNDTVSDCRIGVRVEPADEAVGRLGPVLVDSSSQHDLNVPAPQVITQWDDVTAEHQPRFKPPVLTWANSAQTGRFLVAVENGPLWAAQVSPDPDCSAAVAVVRAWWSR